MACPYATLLSLRQPVRDRLPTQPFLSAGGMWGVEGVEEGEEDQEDQEDQEDVDVSFGSLSLDAPRAEN